MAKQASPRAPRTARAKAPAATARRPGPQGTHPVTGTFRAPEPGRITTLRVRGTGTHVELPAIVAYSLGREPTSDDPATPRAEVRLPSPRKGVSLVHATFEWRKDRLWCRDAGSTNGTFANHEPQRDWFCVTSGMRLDLGDTSVLAMDWRLTDLCAALGWCLGLDATEAVDRAVSLMAKDGPLLLTGPRHCDQEWLARKIHAASERREQPFIALTEKLPKDAETALAGAGFGTVFVDLPRVGKVTAAFARKLFEGEPPHLRVRPIVAAPTHLESQRAFQQLGQGYTLELPALATRRDEILRLVDQLMAQHGSPWRVKDLGERAVERLLRHRWPKNLGELRAAEEKIRALLESANQAEAAKRVGTSRQALAKFLRRMFEG